MNLERDMSANYLLEIGRIGKPHGLRGELVIRLTTNVEERVEVGAEVFLKNKEKFVIENSRPVKSNFVVSLSGIESRTDAESLTGELLFAEPINDPDTKWAHELIGKTVLDQTGNHHGSIIEIQANPASDLLVLDNEALIPVIFIKKINDDKVHVDAPKGLLRDN
jgi:16S rRNA processing protein RimM